jgi:polygalacturonase
VAHLERPGHTLVLADCRDVSVSGVKFTDTAAWTMRIASCRGMHISGVTIHADCSIPNSDGIHLTSSRDAGVLSQSGSMCLLLHERRGRGAALARASVLG